MDMLDLTKNHTISTDRPYTTVVETLTDSQLQVLREQVESEWRRRNPGDLQEHLGQPDMPQAGADTAGSSGTEDINFSPTPAPKSFTNPMEPKMPEPYAPTYSASQNGGSPLLVLSDDRLVELHQKLHATLAELGGQGANQTVQQIQLSHRRVVDELIRRDLTHLVLSPMDMDAVEHMHRDVLAMYRTQVAQSLAETSDPQFELTNTILTETWDQILI